MAIRLFTAKIFRVDLIVKEGTDLLGWRTVRELDVEDHVEGLRSRFGWCCWNCSLFAHVEV